MSFYLFLESGEKNTKENEKHDLWIVKTDSTRRDNIPGLCASERDSSVNDLLLFVMNNGSLLIRRPIAETGSALHG